MFTVKISDMSAFTQFMSCSFASAVTFRIENKKLSLIMPSAEAVAIYENKCDCECADACFCVEKTALSKVAFDDHFTVEELDDVVKISSFTSNGLELLSITTVKKKDIVSLYSDKLNVVKRPSSEISIGPMTSLINFCITFGVPFSIVDGTVSIVLSQNLKIYKKTNSDISLCIRPAFLKFLKINQNVWNKVDNFIYANSGSLYVVCPLDRLKDDSDYKALHSTQFKTKMRANVDFSLYTRAVAKGVRTSAAVFDIEHSRVYMEDESTKFSTMILMSDKQTTSDFEEKPIVLPSQLPKICSVFGSKFKLTHKKVFILLNTPDGVEVIFS